MKNFSELEVQFEDKNKNFTVVTNLPINGNINTFTALVENWSLRTKNHSKKSLIKYFYEKNIDENLVLCSSWKTLEHIMNNTVDQLSDEEIFN